MGLLRRWSKLRSRLYTLMINYFQIHIVLWRMRAEPEAEGSKGNL